MMNVDWKINAGGWEIRNYDRNARGIVVTLDDGTSSYYSYPYIKRWYLRWLYPWAIWRAMKVCQDYRQNAKRNETFVHHYPIPRA